MRRTLRIGTVITAAGALLAGTALVTLPATAATATTAPTLHLVLGNKMLTASWNSISGATGYTFRYSTHKSMSKAHSYTVAALHKSVTKLKNGTTYYATVSPVIAGVLAAAEPKSKVVSAKPNSGSPLTISPSSVTVKSAGENQITVHWSGGGRDEKVGVMAGSDVDVNEYKFNSGWYIASTRTITLTVPSSLVHVLGSGTGNPIFVKVIESNSGSKTFHEKYSYADRYKLTPPGKYALSGAEAAPYEASAPTKVSVGELNTQSYDSSTGFSTTDHWSNRVSRVSAAIEKSHPDVLGTAELSTEVLPGKTCTNSILYQTYPCEEDTQYVNLANDLAKSGNTVQYSMATGDSYRYVINEMRAHPAWTGKVTNGAQIFYNAAKMTLVDHGYISPVFDLHVPGWTTAAAIKGDRVVSWALFQLPNGREFYFLASHYPVGTSKAIATLRSKEANLLTAYIDQMNTARLPIVYTGDMNADAVRDTTPGARQFIDDGYFDASATADRTNARYSSSNGTNGTDGKDPGYPNTAVEHPYATSRIDYIMIKNSPFSYSYQNVVNLHAGTKKFVKSLQGTDHNLQLAQIGIGDPAPAS